jgi:hypothetical protein
VRAPATSDPGHPAGKKRAMESLESKATGSGRDLDGRLRDFQEAATLTVMAFACNRYASGYFRLGRRSVRFLGSTTYARVKAVKPGWFFPALLMASAPLVVRDGTAVNLSTG